MCVMCTRQIWIYQHHSDVFIMNSVFSIRQLIHTIFIIHATDREYIILNMSLIPFFLIYNFWYLLLLLFYLFVLCHFFVWDSYFYTVFLSFCPISMVMFEYQQCIALYMITLWFYQNFQRKMKTGTPTQYTYKLHSMVYLYVFDVRLVHFLFFFSLNHNSISLRCDVIVKRIPSKKNNLFYELIFIGDRLKK